MAYTFNSAGSTAEDWASHRARISAFALKRVGRRLPKKDLNVRAPVMAGRFYPASSEQIDQAIAGYMGAFTEGRQFYPALMLPHAGWQFCGPVIAKTLARASLAPEIILIGPKHTGQGANLSAAEHEYWDIPGARIPLLSQFRQYLIERVPELVADTEAHENEHGVEVLLPFLKKQQPELRILPIAVGSIGAKEIENLSRAIAELYVAHLNETKRPLQLIISSDMNHYAPDEENQRRDKLALQALKSGDPNALLKVCNDQQISMCGLLPTVIIMVALKYVFKSFSPNVVAYQTSAAVTGDSSSVVGYAGVRFGAG